MKLLIAKNLTDYELLDSGEGQRLERFGEYILNRADPQAIWEKSLGVSEWKKAEAVFFKEAGDKGRWVKNNKEMPNSWEIRLDELTIICKLSPFKHTGIFPEQSIHWEFIESVISNASEKSDKKSDSSTASQNDKLNVLNLFGYTGVASLVAAQAGARVTHVDGSYPTIGWARENQRASGLSDKPIRWILDDAVKFCQRELKRGIKYEGIIMDPPIYGHGPKGEKWDFEKDFPRLMEVCSKILSPTPLFVIVNAYAISSSSQMLENVLKDYLKGGEIESGELGLEDKSGKVLSTGIFARWSK